MENAVPQFFGFGQFRDECQVSNRLTDGDFALVSVNDSRELALLGLTVGCDHQQIDILAEQDAVQPRRAVEQLRVIQFRRAVFLSRQDVDARQTQPASHGGSDMHVHVGGDAQGNRPSCRIRETNGDSPAARRNDSTSPS